MLVTDYISEFLEKKALNHCFGLSGANIEDLLFKINSRKKIKIILAKTEYAASMMAIGHYLSSKQISVALTTSGPGILNTVPVLAEAYSSDLPFVLISGLIPQSNEGIGGFQDGSGKGGSINIQNVVAAITGFVQTVSVAQDIPQALREAFLSAEKTKKPSAVFIPKNLFSESIEEGELALNHPVEPEISIDKILLFIEKCSSFSRPPFVVLGEKLIHFKSVEKLNKLLEKMDAFVALTPNAKGFFNHFSPNYLGITGVMGNDEVFDSLSQSQNVVLIGTDLDMLSRFGIEPLLKQKNILVMSEKQSPVAKIVDNSNKYFEINGNLEELIERVEKKLVAQSYFQKRAKKNHDLVKDFTFKSIVEQFSEVIKDDENVFADAGNTGAFVVHDLPLSGKNLFHVFLGMGGMGNSIGACLGSAVGNQKRSFAFMGDGSFLMYGFEIHTAIEYNLPIVFIVFNNNSHAMCSTREDVFLGSHSGINNFKESFLGKGIDQMFPGLRSFDISSQAELQTCLNLLPEIKSPIIISLNISKDEAPPFRSFYKK